ncbi:MAG: TraR/DksA family transcriptional regulator [Planctomycetes bacterium]|nr:TraR/DksA family transcriptional regulator [Planctomycetota bacterium]
MRRRGELLGAMHTELSHSRGDRVGARYNDIADRATDAFYDGLAQEYAEIATADLRLIARAIERIDSQTYGLCEVCSRPIPQARLRALPFAELCVDCKRKEEAMAARYRPAQFAPMLPPDEEQAEPVMRRRLPED